MDRQAEKRGMTATGYLTALLLTLILETAVACALGLKSRTELIAVVGANLASHPIVYWGALFLGGFHPLGAIVFVEAFAVFAEAGMLKFALPGRKAAELFLISLLMNAASFIAGAAFLWSSQP